MLLLYEAPLNGAAQQFFFDPFDLEKFVFVKIYIGYIFLDCLLLLCEAPLDGAAREIFFRPFGLRKICLCTNLYFGNTLIQSGAPLVLRLLEGGIPIINRVFDGFGDELSIATSTV